MKNIKIIEDDITRLQVDVIVNAANPGMLGGGGVDAAIHRAAGPELLAECRKVPVRNGVRCPFGEARITQSGNLLSKYVIHTAGPIYKNESDPASVLRSSYKNSLLLARENNCRSIAFPAISCGVYGYPVKEAAVIAIQTCSDQAFSDMEIIFCLFGSEMRSEWQSIYDRLSA
ncbi:MAG: O-acetyl-ADP-ribose deacetylase [Gammaproteobacteria bacterium]|nr:MAG: O-acetyl-ADP-ribose deacetylase [Gammaproteobacteria bacterium]